jgi:hypothetical protein
MEVVITGVPAFILPLGRKLLTLQVEIHYTEVTVSQDIVVQAAHIVSIK